MAAPLGKLSFLHGCACLGPQDPLSALWQEEQCILHLHHQGTQDSRI